MCVYRGFIGGSADFQTMLRCGTQAVAAVGDSKNLLEQKYPPRQFTNRVARAVAASSRHHTEAAILQKRLISIVRASAREHPMYSQQE